MQLQVVRRQCRLEVCLVGPCTAGLPNTMLTALGFPDYNAVYIADTVTADSASAAVDCATARDSLVVSLALFVTVGCCKSVAHSRHMTTCA